MALMTPYKEGQGIWIRGVMATTSFVVALYASFRLYDYLQVNPDSWLSWLIKGSYVLPVIGWTVDLRLIPVAVVLLGFVGFGVWAYNHPRFVDFLIDTENELTTRVTWPSRGELFNTSAVVVIAAVIIAAWVLLADAAFIIVLREGIYRFFR